MVASAVSCFIRFCKVGDCVLCTNLTDNIDFETLSHIFVHIETVDISTYCTSESSKSASFTRLPYRHLGPSQPTVTLTCRPAIAVLSACATASCLFVSSPFLCVTSANNPSLINHASDYLSSDSVPGPMVLYGSGPTQAQSDKDIHDS
jgi:hypothetical protein